MSEPKLMSAERLAEVRAWVRRGGGDPIVAIAADLLAHIDAQAARLARVEVLLHDATGGAVTDEPNPTTWGAVRFAEHVRKEQVEIVGLLASIFGDEFEDLGDAYGDSFDAVKDALACLDTAAKRWRDRCPVTAEDVEAAGVTAEHVVAWIIAQKDRKGEVASDGRPIWSWRKRRDNLLGPTWQWGPGPVIYRGMPLLEALDVAWISSGGKSKRDILDEMAAMEVQP